MSTNYFVHANKQKGTNTQIRLYDDDIKRIDEWGRKNNMTSRSQSVRHLALRALKEEHDQK